MTKTLLITGATDGIGRETVLRLAPLGHRLFVHGRNAAKVEALVSALSDVDGAGMEGAGVIRGFVADLSDLEATRRLAAEIRTETETLDILINNAGVLKAANPVLPNGLDIRFVVNTLAPWILIEQLLPIMPGAGRIVNLSSAAQAPVDLAAMRGEKRLQDMEAYSQSKLAITMMSRVLAARSPEGPVTVAVNPGSLLATNMVRDGFGIPGNDIGIGADILMRAALSDEFNGASGRYYDNDAGRFGPPHSDALDDAKCAEVMAMIETLAADSA